MRLVLSISRKNRDNDNCLQKKIFLWDYSILIIIILNDYFLDLLAHHLSKTKYQTELAIGSTMASVSAIAKDTSATNIKTVIAIAKCPRV